MPLFDKGKFCALVDNNVTYRHGEILGHEADEPKICASVDIKQVLDPHYSI